MDVYINETWNNQTVMQFNHGSVFRKYRNNTALGNGNIPSLKPSPPEDGRAGQNHHIGVLLSDF